MKRHLIIALTALMAGSSVSLVAEAQPNASEVVAPRVRAGRIAPSGHTFSITFDEIEMDRAYRTAVMMARAEGVPAPSRAEFRMIVNRAIRAAIRERFHGRVPPAGDIFIHVKAPKEILVVGVSPSLPLPHP